MYVIVKQVPMGTDPTGSPVLRPVIMVDNHSEIMEFSDEDEAKRMKEIFERNSTHSSVYEIKKI